MNVGMNLHTCWKGWMKLIWVQGIGMTKHLVAPSTLLLGQAQLRSWGQSLEMSTKLWLIKSTPSAMSSKKWTNLFGWLHFKPCGWWGVAFHVSTSLSFNFCLQYVLNIYSSATFQGSAKPNAIAYTIGVVAIFVTILGNHLTIFVGSVHQRHQHLVV